MKALSLTQPWASAVAAGAKEWETRSWPTNFRGQVCIHAANKFPGWAKDFMKCPQFSKYLEVGYVPLGGILCVCDLTDCRRTEILRTELSTQEQFFGDYSDGRFAFKLENVRYLFTPVEARGMLGFWDVPAEAAEKVERQLIGL